VHRSLGVHNSKVRSTNLDTWLPEQVAFVRAVGNGRGNAYWEAALPAGVQRPAEGDMAALRSFIQDKYVARAFVPRELRADPPTIDNYASHPVRAAAQRLLLPVIQQPPPCPAWRCRDIVRCRPQFLLQLAGGGGAAAAAAAAPAPSAPPPAAAPVSSAAAPAPQFDLLSLVDDSPPGEAASEVANGAEWDPFAAVAADRGLAPAAQAAAAAAAAGREPVDPFAEIERSVSQGSVLSSVPSSAPSLPAAAAPAVDPFAMPPPAARPPPPPAFAQALPAAPAPAPAPRAAGAPMAQGGPAAGVSAHKGSLSHDDILAMFDRPRQARPPQPARGVA
jgi:hypothetical protein